MQKIKLLIFLAVWKRPKITELCFLGLKRLKTHSYFDIESLAVISEESMIPLCEKYGVKYVMFDNSELGRKKNFGLSEARKIDFDYLMEIGSDDIVLNELLDYYSGVTHEFFGVRDIAHINIDTLECIRVMSKSSYGAGRMISRSLLEKMNFKLWNDTLNFGLDNNSIYNVMKKRIGYMQVKPGDFPMIIDVKSDENIWPYDKSLGSQFDKEILFEKLSKEEVDFINSIHAEQQN